MFIFMTISNNRLLLYKNLEQIIGNTKLNSIKLPNNNRLLLKRECDNPFGSHYDRVYLGLFKYYENLGLINPERKVLETTSGTAGASFVGIGKELGYKCHVAIPKGVDRAIIDLIAINGEIYFTLEEDYINGFPRFLKDFLPRNKDFMFLNHSMGEKCGSAYTNNETTLSSLEGITKEVLETEIKIDFYIPAVGNGSTILGPGRLLKNLSPETKIIAFESFQSAVAYDQINPGKYKEEFGINPGTLPKHKLRGTSYQGIEFPHIKNSVNIKLIDEVILVSDKYIDKNYFELTKRKDTKSMPHWDTEIGSEFGRSTRAGIQAALEIAKKVDGKNLLVIAYDKADRYNDY